MLSFPKFEWYLFVLTLQTGKAYDPNLGLCYNEEQTSQQGEL